MPTTDRGKQNPKQSFQDLMAQRYPQPNLFPQTQQLQDLPQMNQQQQQQQQQQQYQGNIQFPVGISLNPAQGVSLSGQPYSSPQTAQNVKGMGGPPSLLQNTNPISSFKTPTPASTSKASMPGGSKTSSGKTESSPKVSLGPTGLVYNTNQQNKLLSSCEWKDKILWASRMILGGNSINGFLRATATAQRIKKQRARQSALARKTAAAAAGTNVDDGEAEKAKSSKPIFDQIEEEKLKKEIMNPRTAKKIKSELEAGIKFCTSLHSVLRTVLFDVDPGQSQYFPPPLEETAISSSTKSMEFQQASASSVLHDSNMPWAVRPNTIPVQQRPSLPKAQAKPSMPLSNTGTSTLRKSRKKKLPPSNEPSAPLPEFDASGKRICTKKEYNFRIFELLRFRPLKQGDFVAARLSSRDLWILAKVLQDYSGFGMSPTEFLNLSETRRDAVFREKVMVRDVEEKEDSASTLVPRSLVLPLPRTYSEAAEWGQRCKKGSRVYAMYPQTTSLYPATVLDSTTYCRDDDDIIVVEFDGEEPDAAGQVPKYHIPARFVTLIPREFSASQGNSTTNKSKRKSSSLLSSAGSAKREKSADFGTPDDFLSLDFGGSGVGNFDSLVLDFDAPLEAGEEGMDEFPVL